MLTNWNIFWCLLSQVFSSLLCTILLVLVACTFIVWLEHPHKGGWQTYYAHIVVGALCCYVGIRLGFHFGRPHHDLPDGWLLGVFKIGFSLAVIWKLVAAGALDLWVALEAFIQPDDWYAIDEIFNYSTTEWWTALVYSGLSYIGIFLLARWCFGSRKPQAPNGNLKSEIG